MTAVDYPSTKKLHNEVSLAADDLTSHHVARMGIDWEACSAEFDARVGRVPALTEADNHGPTREPTSFPDRGRRILVDYLSDFGRLSPGNILIAHFMPLIR